MIDIVVCIFCVDLDLIMYVSCTVNLSDFALSYENKVDLDVFFLSKEVGKVCM